MIYFFIILLLFAFLFFTVILYYLIYTSYSSQAGAIYYPSKKEAVDQMLKLAGVTDKDTVFDLGSGDGRIIIAAAQKGAKAVGFEIDPILVWQSRQKIKKAKVENLAKVCFQSFWKADFNQATVITLYLFPRFMDKLQDILEKKLTHPLILVSNDYEFPRKKYFKKQGKIYLYQFP